MPDGIFREAAPAVPRFARDPNRAKGRAATLRLMALATRDPAAKHDMQARAEAVELGLLREAGPREMGGRAFRQHHYGEVA